MKWFCCVMILLSATMLGGCAGSTDEVETTAPQDELRQWAAENPETDDEVDPDAQ
jgi:hypothetical protein